MPGETGKASWLRENPSADCTCGLASVAWLSPWLPPWSAPIAERVAATRFHGSSLGGSRGSTGSGYSNADATGEFSDGGVAGEGGSSTEVRSGEPGGDGGGDLYVVPNACAQTPVLAKTGVAVRSHALVTVPSRRCATCPKTRPAGECGAHPASRQGHLEDQTNASGQPIAAVSRRAATRFMPATSQ